MANQSDCNDSDMGRTTYLTVDRSRGVHVDESSYYGHKGGHTCQ